MSESKKQYHYIVMVDANGEVSIDWDTTQVMLEEHDGTIFDTKTEEWEPGFGDQNYENIADRLALQLKKLDLR